MSNCYSHFLSCSYIQIKAAEGRIFVDVGRHFILYSINLDSLVPQILVLVADFLLRVGFWGGLVPENAFNSTALEQLLEAGALGLKVHIYILFINEIICD